jgi:hypothetical protein
VLVVVAAGAGIGVALSGGGSSSNGAGGASGGSSSSQTTPAEPPLSPPQAIGAFQRQPGGTATPGDVFDATYQRASPLAGLVFTVARAAGPPPGVPVLSRDTAQRTRATVDLVNQEIRVVRGTLFAPGVSTIPVTSGTTQYTCLSGPSSPSAQGQVTITACVWSAGFTTFVLADTPGPSPQEVVALAAQAQAAMGL